MNDHLVVVAATDLDRMIRRAVTEAVKEIKEPEKRQMTVSQAAAKLGCSRSTIYQRIRSNQIEHRKGEGMKLTVWI